MNSLRHAFTFALHTIVGIALFGMIAGAVWVLHVVTAALQTAGLPPYILSVLTFVEYLLFAIDVLSLVVFVSTECVTFLRHLLGS